MLLDSDGLEALRRLRANGDVPVLFLAADNNVTKHFIDFVPVLLLGRAVHLLRVGAPRLRSGA